jgi:tetratricopeptide (TPR) repeat protein
MPQPSPSNAENDYRNPLDAFTDREAILALFEQTLRSARAGQLHVLAVKGNSGTGKTFLVSNLAERVCPRFQWQIGQMRFAQSVPDFRTILLGLEDALKGNVPSAHLEHYRAARDEYNRRFDEYKATISIGSIQQQMVVRGEQSSIANSPQSIQINTQLHERELHLRSELARALLELAESDQQSLCLFIDGYERLTALDSELVGWLWEDVLPGLSRAIPHPFLVTTCGWEWPSDTAIEPFIRRVELADFDMEQMKSYLQKQEVLSPPTTPTEVEREDLINTFYELTKGHPLVLGLAVTYFQHLDRSEQTASHLRANMPLLDTRARVEFLEQRLLNHLPEPYRTLLERGPILRFLDQGALQALLRVEIEGMTDGIKTLDDTIYDRFLRYPFIKRESRVEDGLQHLEPSFHELVRRVQLETLRRRPHDAKEQLHRTMADFYGRRAEAERVGKVDSPEASPKRMGTQPSFSRMWDRMRHLFEPPSKKTRMEPASRDQDAQWLTEITEHEFRVPVEYLYHSLQVRTRQAEAFDEWEKLMGQAIGNWRRQQARSLLALVRQLVEEGEPFFSKTSHPYGYYLLWYARFLEQEVHWQQAQTVLEEAAKIFEQVGNQAGFSRTLNNLAALYYAQGKYEQAEPLYQRALTIWEKQLGPEHSDTATSLNNLAELYRTQGKYEQAEPLYQRALAIWEKQLGPEHPDTATSLNNLAGLYDAQGKYEQAEPLYQRALAIYEKQLGPEHPYTATSLNNLAGLYRTQGKYEQAEPLYQRALAIYEKQLGPEHPDTTTVRENYYALVRNMKQKGKEQH